MKKVLLAVVTAVFASLTSAQAALVSVSSLMNQTISGEDFNFQFNGLGPTDGSGGTLVLRAQGDYDGATNETLAWDAEGIIGSAAVGGFVNGANGVGGPFDFANVNQPLGNIEFQRTYTLSNAVLSALLADGALDIFVDIAAVVGLFNPPNFVEFTLSYNDMAAVPLPAALPLLISGLGGLGFMSRRRKQAAAKA